MRNKPSISAAFCTTLKFCYKKEHQGLNFQRFKSRWIFLIQISNFKCTFFLFPVILNQCNFSYLIFSHWLYFTAVFACREYTSSIASAVMPLWLTANFTKDIADQPVTLEHECM